jgi:IS5 family transposase
MKCAQKATRKLKTYLGSVMRDIQSQAATQLCQKKTFRPAIANGSEIEQEKTSKSKLDSLHSPETYCACKGKPALHTSINKRFRS